VEKRFLWTFAIGHFALGYLVGKGSAKLAKVKINVPLLLAASVLPDVDLLLRFLMHRVPTHSFIAITALMIPFFAVYRKKAFPYYAALLSHIFIGDFFIGGIELLWPLSQGWFEVLNITTTSLSNIAIELVLFVLTLLVMYKLGDLQALRRFNSKSWALIIPSGAILGPLLSIGRGQENALPILLVIPSLFYLALFSYSFIVWLKGKPNPGRTETKGEMEKLIKANRASYKSDSN
jgi:membrane-bound metal-dependent hydrolase YbcI (DUF457 family)